MNFEDHQGQVSLAKLNQCNSVSWPEQKLHGEQVPEDELKWSLIGSGMYARTFLQADRLAISTKSGPLAADVERRIIRDADTGKVIDDCGPDDTPTMTCLGCSQRRGTSE